MKKTLVLIYYCTNLLGDGPTLPAILSPTCYSSQMAHMKKPTRLATVEYLKTRAVIRPVTGVQRESSRDVATGRWQAAYGRASSF